LSLYNFRKLKLHADKMARIVCRSLADAGHSVVLYGGFLSIHSKYVVGFCSSCFCSIPTIPRDNIIIIIIIIIMHDSIHHNHTQMITDRHSRSLF
jgi:hypothetical protein